MKLKRQSLLLLVMTVLLLVVISSRISSGGGNSRNTEESTADSFLPENILVTDTPSIPMYEPVEPIRIRELLPGLSLSDWNLKLVNNTYVLPNSFAPDVTKIREEQYFDTRAAESLEAMLSGAEAAGYTVSVRAAYRPFSTQAYLFNGRASQIQWGTDMSLIDAETQARKVVAYPGTSEHQLGLCADILDSPNSALTAETSENLPVLLWLHEHCAEYGFIYRYPKEKMEITGWYEPWHFRYVGEEAATYIMEHNLCLEEFIEQY